MQVSAAGERANVAAALRRAELIRAGAYASGNSRRIRQAEAEVTRYAKMLRRLPLP